MTYTNHLLQTTSKINELDQGRIFDPLPNKFLSRDLAYPRTDLKNTQRFGLKSEARGLQELSQYLNHNLLCDISSVIYKNLLVICNSVIFFLLRLAKPRTQETLGT